MSNRRLYNRLNICYNIPTMYNNILFHIYMCIIPTTGAIISKTMWASSFIGSATNASSVGVNRTACSVIALA
jgi:hypothetical protein